MKVIAGLLGTLLLGACEGEKPPATETRQIADAPKPDRSRNDVDAGSADDGAATTVQPGPADPGKPEDGPVEPTPIAPESTSSSSDEPVSPQVAEPGDSGGSETSSMPPGPVEDADTDTDAGAGPADSTPPSDTCSKEPLSALSASEVNNYRFSRTLSFPVVMVAPDSDLTFEWSALAHDIRGREVDPEGDVDTLMLTQWRLTPEEFTVRANADLLVQNDLVAVVVIYTEQARTSGTLLEMTSFGMPLEAETLLGYFAAEDFPPEQYTYAAAVVDLQTSVRMIQAFRLDPDSGNTLVELTDDSTELEYTVDIQGACPTVVPTGATDLEIDWSTIETTASGLEFVPSSVTEVIVARYAMSVAELETNVLVLDTLAERTYRNTAPVGNRVEFESLVGDDGSSFPGVDSDATWVIALVCGSCSNPAPWYLSVLETP
jgi:hypothetical protein